MNNATSFDDFLKQNLTVHDYYRLDELLGSKRMSTIRKRDPRSLTTEQILTIAELLTKQNPEHDAQFIIEHFIMPTPQTSVS